jgi:hypothetical protein
VEVKAAGVACPSRNSGARAIQSFRFEDLSRCIEDKISLKLTNGLASFVRLPFRCDPRECGG